MRIVVVHRHWHPVLNAIGILFLGFLWLTVMFYWWAFKLADLLVVHAVKGTVWLVLLTVAQMKVAISKEPDTTRSRGSGKSRCSSRAALCNLVVWGSCAAARRDGRDSREQVDDARLAV